MPVKVIMRLLQNMTVHHSSDYCTQIYSAFKCILKMNSDLVNEYITNEGELWEVLVDTLERLYRGLPISLMITSESSLWVEDLIKENFLSKVNNHDFLEAYKKFIEYLKFFDEWVYLTHNIQIVETISSLFFNEFLMKLQDDLINKDNLIRFRTVMQYLIQILYHITHPSITDVIFYFLFGFPEDKPNLKVNQEILLDEASKE